MAERSFPESLSNNSQVCSVEEFDWGRVVEKLHLDARPVLVRVTQVNDVTAQDDVFVGAELRLHDAMIEKMHIKLCDCEQMDLRDAPPVDCITLPVSFEGKVMVCPFYSAFHTFSKVQELIDVYPFIGDFIYPLERVEHEDFTILEFELLQIIGTVHDLQLGRMLEVNVITRKKRILLPYCMECPFKQWNDDYEMKEIKLARMENPRTYSLMELSELICTHKQPLMVKLYKKQYCQDENENVLKTKKCLKTLIASKFKRKKKTQPKVSQPHLPEPPCENERMFPESWWEKPLTIHPSCSVIATNQNTGTDLKLSGELNAKVLVLS